MKRYSTGVGDLSGIERLAALQNELAIQKAAQPSTFDKVANIGVAGFNSVMNWRKGNQKLQADKAVRDEQRAEQVLDMKFKAGAPMEDKDFISLGMEPAKGREWVKQKQELIKKDAQPSVKKLVANTATGMMDIFDTRSGETFAGTIPISEATKDPKKPRVYSFNKKDMLGNSTIVFYTQDPNDPTKMIEMVQKGSERSMQSDGPGGEAKAPAGMHFELDPVTGEKNLVKD